MKIIITEEQYRLIIENEGRLFPVSEEMLNQDNGITKFYNLFEKTKDVKNWVGFKVIGDLSLEYQDDEHLEDFCKYLVEVTGDFDIEGRKDFEFDSLVKIGGSFKVTYSSVPRNILLPKLKYVGEFFIGQDSDIKRLPELEYVGESLSLRGSHIKDLPKLKYVGDVLNIMYTPFSDKTTEEELRSKINVGGNIWL
jgi:hypothetical protein